MPNWDEVAADHAAMARPDEAMLAEMTIWIGPDWTPSQESISRAFDQGLRALNRLVMGYSLATLDPFCADVEKEQLPPVCLMTFKDLAAPYYAHDLFRLHRADSPVKRQLSPDALLNIENRVASPRPRDGLRVFNEARIRAGRHFEQGNYLYTVHSSALAIEGLVGWALTCRAEELGEPTESVETMFRDKGIHGIVKREMHGWLGGKWDTSTVETPAGRWAAFTNNLRNQCAHQGYRPSYREALLAFDTGREFSTFLVDRLKASGYGSWIEPNPFVEDTVTGTFIWEKSRVEENLFEGDMADPT